MKKYINIVLVAVTLVFGTTSCSDFLEEDNKTGETADLAYQTTTGIDGLVASAYAYCRGWWGKEPALGLSEMGSDLFYYGYDNKQKSLCSYNVTSECYGFLSTSGTTAVNDNHCLDQYWELFYAGIDVCNNALKYVPECATITQDKMNGYLGDAYFLRALYYSQLVALWGPVPYNSEPFTETNMNPVRVPENEVYKNILVDCDSAMSKYSKAHITNISKATGTGRATYYSAEALKARVALYAASWLGASSIPSYDDNLYNVASKCAGDVISKSGAKFYSRYSDTWNLNNEEATTNTENLFATHYINDNLSTNTENCVPYRFADNGKGTYNSLLTRTGYDRGGSAMNLMFVSLWNNGCADLGGSGNTSKSIFQRVTNDENGLIVSSTTGVAVDVSKYYSPYGRGFTRYLPSLYLWTILDEVKNTDQRYNGTLLTCYNCPMELAGNPANYPNMKDQTEKSYDEAYQEDGNYFNGGVHAIVYSLLDGDSKEGLALQADAKNKYRLQFAYNGDIPVYTSGDPATALPTEGGKAISDVYGDARYSDAKIEGRRSYPGIKKFLDDQVNDTYPNLSYDISPRDIMVLRLAEMYLIEAEAQLQTGNPRAAAATIDELREARKISGLDANANSIENVYGETTPTIETILRERALELCGEFQRWFDLKRTHTLLDHVKKYNAQGSANIKAIHYYRPIPATEFESVRNRGDITVAQDANGVLQYTQTAETFWQNPGY